jgi:hypothetical protein
MPNVDQLKMIQAIIDRMGRNSFALKGWSVAVAAALLGFAKADSNRDFAWIAVGTVTMYWILDAYYLALEKSFIELYNTSAASVQGSWSLTPRKVRLKHVLGAARRPAVVLIHIVTLIAAIAVALTA